MAELIRYLEKQKKLYEKHLRRQAKDKLYSFANDSQVIIEVLKRIIYEAKRIGKIK